MISKARFIEIASRGGASPDEISAYLEKRNWDRICAVAAEVKAQMPGIGFFSRAQRMSTFIAVCRHLDQLLDFGELSDLGDTQIVLSVLRLTSKRFLKAAVMFDLNAHRIDLATRVLLPRTATEYMAGLNFYGS